MNSRKPYPFFQIDVFASRAGNGNPLAVMFDALSLDTITMQAIAAWTGLAETTFVLPPTTADADYRVRIFTTQREIAFAGHPSIGTAHAVLATGHAKPRNGVLTQECQAGLLPIRVTGGDAEQTLFVRVPRSRIVQYAQDTDIVLHRAIKGLRLANLAPALVEGGRRWWLAELADENCVRQMKPDVQAIRDLAAETQSLGLCVFARCANASDGLVVRAFPLGVGIVEDPASGAANAAIGAFLNEAKALGALGQRYRVSQGREIGHDATLLLEIDDAEAVWVGGQSQSVIGGKLMW